jgi:hypothetical protein
MSLDIRVEPIDRWPGEQTVSRSHSSFRTTYSATVDLLERELTHVRAQAVVMQQAISRSDLRLDGRVRADARLAHPGVILSFTSPKLGKIRFACDRFYAWQDNVRAIALGMEALRKVDRYGITSDGEQYAGFRALEAAEAARPFETLESAGRFIAAHARPDLDDGRIEALIELVLTDDELLETYYRRAAKNLHPDAGGSDAGMARLSAARAMIEDHP